MAYFLQQALPSKLLQTAPPSGDQGLEHQRFLRREEFLTQNHPSYKELTEHFEQLIKEGFKCFQQKKISIWNDGVLIMWVIIICCIYALWCHSVPHKYVQLLCVITNNYHRRFKNSVGTFKYILIMHTLYGWKNCCTSLKSTNLWSLLKYSGTSHLHCPTKSKYNKVP